MATLSLPTPYSNGDTVTPTNLNAHVTGAVVNFSNSDTDNSTLEVSSNQFRIKDAGVTKAKVAAGLSVQTIEATPITSVQTITATIPLDNTKPQNTEGTELWSQAISLVSGSRVLVDARIQLSNGASGTTAIASIFRDSGADALATNFISLSAQQGGVLSVRLLDSPAAVSATYKVRIGIVSGGGTLYVSGSGAGANLFGSTLASTLTLTEIKA